MDEEGINVAVNMVKTAPVAVKTPVAWNTLISEMYKARKYQAAYDMYTEVCDRPVRPLRYLVFSYARNR